MQRARATGIPGILLVACLCAVQACSSSGSDMRCAPADTAPAATSAAISSALEEIKNRFKLDGIIFGAEQNGEPLVRTALGASTSGVPASTDMHFRIGAVGWQVLTTVLLRLTEQADPPIALNDPASRWFAEYPHAEQATVRMLAASSAGFGDYITAPAFLAQVEANPLRVWTADDLIALSVAPYQSPQFDDPGRDWQYSHTGFVMLGAILEKASGKSYERLLQELILDPLALRETRLQLDVDPQLPVLQTLEEEHFRDTTFWNPSFVSWAALTSNICDLGKWNRAFGTGALLGPGTRGEVTSQANVGLGGNTPSGYFGLGTLVYPPWLVQRAAYWGMYTTTAYDPTTGISLAATVSISPGTPANVQPANEIVTAISKLLTPDHPVSE